ncbi:MAG: zinc ribbon domain-containing protein, partial [Actinomycetota bacterium]
MTCPNCGTENVADARFCVSCGRDLSDPGAPVQADVPTGPDEAGTPTGPIDAAAPTGSVPPAPPTVPPAPPTVPPAPPTEQIGVVAATEPTIVGAPTAPPPRSTLSAGWSTALARGALAFAVMVALGQAIAFGAYAAAGRSIVVTTVARIGGVYFELFHRVGIEFRASNLSGSSIAGAAGAVGGLSLTISVGLLLATLLAIVLLFRAGRAVADAAGGPMLARVVHGMKPSIVYGVLAFAFSFLIHFHIAVPSNPVFSGEINVEPSHLAAFLYPFLIALVAGAAGGLRSAGLAGGTSEPWGRRTLGVWGGGVRMLALGLVLSFVGLLVLAALDPTTTADYFRGAFNGGAARGTVLVGHHVLLSPNQSMWVLVPSMGGSLNLSIAGSNVELLSYSHFPEHLSLTGGPTSGFGTPIPSVQGGTAPIGYFLFLLVPLLSVLIG